MAGLGALRMFDSIGTFTKQFTPAEGGYLYYTSKKSGGKLVTVSEYERLVDDWRKVAGRRGTWMTAGAVILVIAIWTAISKLFTLPDWFDSIIVAASVIGISTRIVWAIYAPRRLVGDRPSITPPRPTSEVRRQARALLSWRLIIFSLLLTGIIFFGSLSSAKRDIESWAWLIGSGAMFFLYIWIAIQKFRDQ